VPVRQRATFFELFFDLVYVFAVTTQLSHHLLAAKLGWAGAAETAFMLIAVYWAWNHRSTFSSTWYRRRSRRFPGQGGPGASGCGV
jgi:low temperature requirement protein LtrA